MSRLKKPALEKLSLAEILRRPAVSLKNLVEKEEVKNYLNDILESLTNGVIVVDRSGRITTFNQTAGNLTGLKPQNCLGKTMKEVFPFDLFENLVSRLEKNRRETAYQDQDITTPEKKIIHARVSASPVWDNHGGQIGTVLILQDRTDLRRLEEFAHRNQRLREMGEMAAGIAHEIRNPLGSIELFASLLKKDLEEDHEKVKLVQHIRAGVQNMDRIISTLLLFAKSSQPSRQQCDINLLLAELLDGLDDIRVPDNIKVVREFGNEEMLANGDRELLRQVFPNLIRNALQPPELAYAAISIGFSVCLLFVLYVFIQSRRPRKPPAERQTRRDRAEN